MAKEVLFTVIENKNIAKSVYQMTLSGDTSSISAPGQFVNISIPSLYLRRPISVCDVSGNQLTLIYKVVGKGTEALSKMDKGTSLTILTGLGNGYDLNRLGEKVTLLGGGVGVPPMYYLAKQCLKAGKKVEVILGFNTQDEIFFEEEFKALNIPVKVFTVDGSYGEKGFVTGGFNEENLHNTYCACGPLPMLKAIYKTADHGFMSLEARMGCGFGGCMGCSMETKNGPKRVCKEGPVFESEELLWND